MKTKKSGEVFVSRSQKTRASQYIRIDNAVVQNANLSYRARGLLAYILSKPVDFRHSVKRLAGSGEKRCKVTAALNELAAAGYAQFENRRTKAGKIENLWRFSESPTPPSPSAENLHSAPSADPPLPVQPVPVELSVGKPALYETKVVETKDLETTEGETTDLAESAEPAPAESDPDDPADPPPPDPWQAAEWQPTTPEPSTSEISGGSRPPEPLRAEIPPTSADHEPEDFGF